MFWDFVGAAGEIAGAVADYMDDEEYEVKCKSKSNKEAKNVAIRSAQMVLKRKRMLHLILHKILYNERVKS